MKILVALKRVIDYNVRIQIKPDGSGIVNDGVKMSINPFDEIALEEALRIREAGHAEEVIVTSIGPDTVQQQLRTGLAMGADRAIQVNTSTDMQPLFAARVFHALAEREKPGIFLLGKQAIDDDCNQTAQMLAALWQRPQATFASRVEIISNTARVTREVDQGLETLDVSLPAVISSDLRLNEPRFVKLPEIMKAKRKPLDVIALEELAVEAPPQLQYGKYQAPEKRSAGRMLADTAELYQVLKEGGLA